MCGAMKTGQTRLRKTALVAILAAGVSALVLIQHGAATNPLLDDGVTSGLPSGTAAFAAPDKPFGSVEALKTGLDALSSRDMPEARAIRDSLPSDSLDRHILAWAIAMKGGREVPSTDIAKAASALPGWPGGKTLQRNLERALLWENPAPASVLRLLGSAQPLTPEGAIILARAQVELGKPDAARKVLSEIWRTAKMDAASEAAILTEFSVLIPTADHRFRMERMFYADRPASAMRLAKLARAEPLAIAWNAVLQRDPKAAKLMEAVPAELRGAGYMFARAEYLRRQKQYEAAAGAIAKAPRDQAALVDPDAWWIERRVLSRELLAAGKPKLAYQVAAAHSAESPTNAADAEFHAGWYALRFLGDPATAAKHFGRIAELSEGPISRARAYYWLGRTAEAGGPGSAADYYENAASFGTTFYGQLAAQKLGRKTLNVTYPAPSDADRSNFPRREAVRALTRLAEASYAPLADTLYLDLAEQLTSPGELALLAVIAEQRNNHYLALKVGKIAAQRGLDIGALSHPIGAIPASANISASGTALAYAIARQESEFNIGAVSSAGAHGLLQLMPGTAEEVARKVGLPFSKIRLTTDAAYNATLGAAFLGQQLERFRGSYILTFIGYNAGPRRADQWVRRYGDPRGKDLDAVVDWIEGIPYAETRAYVQRVMENYQVYKMRLSGKFDIENDLLNGR